MNDRAPALFERRAFFGRLLTVLALPAPLASLLKRPRSTAGDPETPKPTTPVTIHPLAVPRQDKGSQLHG